jgi:hypothetical protein
MFRLLRLTYKFLALGLIQGADAPNKLFGLAMGKTPYSEFGYTVYERQQQ